MTVYVEQILRPSVWKARKNSESITTYTGIKFFPLNARPDEIDVDDIAHALSNICRFTGHTSKFYSVAQHSVYVSRLLPDKYKLWGLLHDASEAYLCDISSPIKHSPTMSAYRIAEDKLMKIICEKYGLQFPMPNEVHIADKRMLAGELKELTNNNNWASVGELPPFAIIPWSPEKAKKEFLKTFTVLYDKQ